MVSHWLIDQLGREGKGIVPGEFIHSFIQLILSFNQCWLFVYHAPVILLDSVYFIMRETEPLHFSMKSGGFDFHMGTVPKDNWLKTKWIASDSSSLQPNQRRLPRVNETITFWVFDTRWLFRDLGFHIFKSKNDSEIFMNQVKYLFCD